MRIGSSTDKKDSGKIHVDFAQARDDLYEWECKQRLWAREERHRRKVQEDLLRPPSPPPIVHYSEHEAALLAEKLKGKRPLVLWSHSRAGYIQSSPKRKMVLTMLSQSTFSFSVDLETIKRLCPCSSVAKNSFYFRCLFKYHLVLLIQNHVMLSSNRLWRSAFTAPLTLDAAVVLGVCIIHSCSLPAEIPAQLSMWFMPVCS